MRLLFPKDNAERTLKIKKMSPAAYVILDTLRQWKINQIASEIAKLQARPRAVYAGDCQPLLRDIYRPLYILEDLIVEIDIEDAFNILYKALFLESPTQETEQSRIKMTEAIAAFRYIKNNIRYLLYPLLMKNIADLFCSYDAFFTIYAEQLAAFLGVSPEDKLRPAQTKTAALVDMVPGMKASVVEAETGTDIADLPDDAAIKKAEEVKKETESESKAVDKGLTTLEALFPKAGWNKLPNFPDLFPYFAAVLSFKKGCELISPRDPTQLGLVLSAIIEEMLFGFRSIQFAGKTFYDAYLRLIDEYVGVLKSSGGNSKGSYAMNLINDIHWARRYYFFPHYDYKSGLPPSFSKKDIRSMFSLARRLRNVLTDVAVSIDGATRAGGAAVDAICKDINNPWAPYLFEISNPISRRLNMILPKDQRSNVGLIFFTLAAATVLDNLFNSPASIAYTAANHREVFRSVNDEGHEPILWVDKRTDVEAIFKESLGGRKGAL